MSAISERSNGQNLSLTHAPKPAMSDTALSNLTDSDRFQQLQRVATMMGTAAFTPAHLKGRTQQETIANCFRVVNQAMRWGFDPFAVGDETYVVQGKLGYQGKLVAAVINARAGLKGRLRPEYSGKGEDRTVTIIGQFASEDSPRTIELVLKNAKTSNGMWTKDPDQKLWYSGVIKWSRRHCPELILGVMTEDDLERIQETDSGVNVETSDLDKEIMGETVEAHVEETPAQVEEKEPFDPDREDALDAQAADIDDQISSAKTELELSAAGSAWKEIKDTLGDVRNNRLDVVYKAAYKRVAKK